MSNSIYRVLFRSSNRASYPYPVLHNVRICPFSSIAPESILPTTANHLNDPSTMNYLINSFGLSQQKAFTASRYSKISSAENVNAFLKKRGFTADEIGSIVRSDFKFLLIDTEKTLNPKIDFFLSSGLSQAEVNNIILKAPSIFSRSLKNIIIPHFNYIKTFFDSNGARLSFTEQFAGIFCCNFECQLVPNIDILRDAGVPDSRIMMLLRRQPRVFRTRTEKFREVVNDVKQMNFDPCGGMFTVAVHAIRSMSKLTWETKLEAYKKWGLSVNDILMAFQRSPYCMTLSIGKINEVMDFFINELGLDSSLVVKRPTIVSYSLKKRIKPRCSVYKVLLDINKAPNLSVLLSTPEPDFLNKFVLRYEKDEPNLSQIYQKALVVSKTTVC